MFYDDTYYAYFLSNYNDISPTVLTFVPPSSMFINPNYTGVNSRSSRIP